MGKAESSTNVNIHVIWVFSPHNYNLEKNVYYISRYFYFLFIYFLEWKGEKAG